MEKVFETVATFRNLTTAQFYQSLLEENGIAAFLPEENTVATRAPDFWFINLQANIRLQVPHDEKETALAVLHDVAAYGHEVEAMSEGEEVPAEVDSARPAEEEPLPAPDAGDFSGLRLLFWLAGISVLVLLLWRGIQALAYRLL
jgi:hypothetical protein